MVEKAVCEFMTRCEVRPQASAAECETVERCDSYGKRNLLWSCWPDLVASGAVLLQVRLPSGDENAGGHAIVVR